ncbi:MAG: hypothetical protein LUD79_10025 [Oscillospiraceae bacterium]|nr:hypothetical protein [Oscillospiraceae bacterium]
MSKQAATFASVAIQSAIGLRYLRAWLRRKFDVRSRSLAAFFLRQGKQGVFFGGSTPFLFAPSKRNGVEKAHSEMNTKSGETSTLWLAELFARKLIFRLLKHNDRAAHRFDTIRRPACFRKIIDWVMTEKGVYEVERISSNAF